MAYTAISVEDNDPAFGRDAFSRYMDGEMNEADASAYGNKTLVDVDTASLTKLANDLMAPAPQQAEFTPGVFAEMDRLAEQEMGERFAGIHEEMGSYWDYSKELGPEKPVVAEQSPQGVGHQPNQHQANSVWSGMSVRSFGVGDLAGSFADSMTGSSPTPEKGQENSVASRQPKAGVEMDRLASITKDLFGKPEETAVDRDSLQPYRRRDPGSDYLV